MKNKTELEKMLAGVPYNARDPELMGLYKKARQLIAKYNTLYDASEQDRYRVLQELCGKLGKNVWIEPPFFCDYGCNIRIGDNTFINFNCVFLDCNVINIGCNVFIAPAVQIYAVTHPIAPEKRIIAISATEKQAADISAPVNIADNVWIGGGAIILPGVNIGEGSTIGAGSVVTKDIPSRVLAYGNPCRVIKAI